MFKPHKCIIERITGGLDSFRNPIVKESETLVVNSCFLDQNLPNNPIFTPDGQTVQDASGIIFLDKGSLDLSLLKIGDNISVLDKKENIIFKGIIKTFSEDLFHNRIWV